VTAIDSLFREGSHSVCGLQIGPGRTWTAIRLSPPCFFCIFGSIDGLTDQNSFLMLFEDFEAIE
jgi:hypothetical protein